MAYRLLRRPWRLRKAYYLLMIPELAFVVALLVLFGIAQPDTYRTTLWQIGYDNRFNSNPSMILYAYANREPLPTIPFVWSSTITNFNVAISVLSLFLLISKLIAVTMHVYFPIIGTFVSFSMTALYAASVYGQAGPDYADSRYPSKTPWYLSKGCSYAEPYGVTADCLMAVASFAVTVLMLVYYLITLGFGIFALLPNKHIDEADANADSDDDSPVAPSSKQWEMQPQTYAVPLSPRAVRGAPGSMGNVMSGAGSSSNMGYYGESPFTPRTEAFHRLDRKLPLRA